MLDALRGLTWPARHVVRSGATGAHRSRVRGPAPEFSEYRSFRQGDDPRRLDWRLLARTDRAYLRLTEDRATLGTLLFLDASASMDFPEGDASKWRVAVNLAQGLAQVAHQAGDPVGVVVAGRPAAELPLRTRRGVVSEIAAALERVSPGGSASIGEEFARHPLSSRVVIISDFLDDGPAALRTIAGLVGRGGEAYALRVVAREEIDPPGGVFSAVDPERPAFTRAFGPDARASYGRRFADWGAEVAGRWRAAGARWNDVVTDERLLRAVRRITGKTA